MNKSLKQWQDFHLEEKIETMDRLAIIQEQKIFEPTIRISISRKIVTMGRLDLTSKEKNR